MRLFLVAALAIVAAGVVTWIYWRDRSAALARVSGVSQIARSPHGPIEYAVRGEGAPVLAIHGTGGGFEQGFAVADLVPPGHRIIAPSRFGYLRSADPRDASPAAQADAFSHLLRTLGAERAVAIGVSAGALSAIEFAARHPDQCAGLILLVPASYLPKEQRNLPPPSPVAMAIMTYALRWDFIFWAALKMAPSSMIRSLLATDPALVAAAAPDERERALTLLRHIMPVSRRWRGMLHDGAFAGDPPRPAFEKISAPTLIISLEDDYFGTYANARYAAAHIRNARFVGYPVGGHVWIGRQRDIAAEIAGFLRQIVWLRPAA
jgi:pimeloyl-ACP methyl ester carboxylesterase